MNIRIVAAVAAVLGLIAFSTRADDAPGPQVTSAPDSVRLLHDLSVLAHDSMEGRAPGTTGSARARAFLTRELAQAGVDPVGESYEHAFVWGQDGSGTNLIGRVAGRDGAGVIVLTAHYDHEGVRDGEIFNGADDNASGTAAVLEIARLTVAEPLSNTLIIALVDAEESGLQGARAFVRDPPLPLERVSLNVNLDMVSRSEGLLWAGGAYHTPSLRPILEEVAATVPVTLRLGHDRPGAPEGNDWTGSSDHAPFHAAGIPFVYFGVEDHPDYHRSTDDFERVDPSDYVNSVRAIVTALRALDDALPLPTPTDAR